MTENTRGLKTRHAAIFWIRGLMVCKRRPVRNKLYR